MVAIDQWPAHYPAPARLGRDIELMVAAIKAAVVATFGAEAVVGLYFKGSAQKPWHSLVDYVPGLSDVDMHLRLTPAEAPRFDQMPTALQLSAAIDHEFQLLADETADGEFFHVPRPQITLLNALEAEGGVFASPASIVETIYGVPYEGADYTGLEAVRVQDRASLIANAEAAQAIAGALADRNGEYLWDLLRRVSWRLSPTASRALSVAGLDPQFAWTQPRTLLIAALRDAGLAAIADPYEAWFVAAWEYSLSSLQRSGPGSAVDGDAARRAMQHAYDCLTRASDWARSTAPAAATD